MAVHSKIQWCDNSWNPILGCSRQSSGCAHCYAVRTCWRLAHNPNPKVAAAYAGLVEKRDNGLLDWTGVVRLIPERLALPLSWKEPKRIFTNSQSDLFHPALADEDIDHIFAIMALCPQHTFQILTKQPERMRAYMQERDWCDAANRLHDRHIAPLNQALYLMGEIVPPLPNVWLGVSVEDQKTADARIPLLLRTPAAIRFVSYEPALAPVDFVQSVNKLHWLDPAHFCPGGIDWIIVGGELGANARPFPIDIARDTIRQCKAAGVACFVKQLGAVPVMDEAEWRGLTITPMLYAKNHARAPEGTVPLLLRDNHGGDWDEWMPELRVREFPQEATR